MTSDIKEPTKFYRLRTRKGEYIDIGTDLSDFDITDVNGDTYYQKEGTYYKEFSQYGAPTLIEVAAPKILRDIESYGVTGTEEITPESVSQEGMYPHEILMAMRDAGANLSTLLDYINANPDAIRGAEAYQLYRGISAQLGIYETLTPEEQELQAQEWGYVPQYPQEERYYSQEEAAEDLGVEIEAGWQVYYHPPAEEGAAPTVTFISPEGEEVDETEYMSRLSAAQASGWAEPSGLEELLYISQGITPGISQYEGLSDEELLFAEYQRTGGTFSFEQWVESGKPIRPGGEKVAGITVGQIQEAYSSIFPDRKVADIFAQMQVDENMPVTERQRAEQAQNDFMQTLIDYGRAPETETILKSMGFDDEEINAFFEPIAQQFQYVEESVAKDWADAFYSSFNSAMHGFRQTGDIVNVASANRILKAIPQQWIPTEETTFLMAEYGIRADDVMGDYGFGERALEGSIDPDKLKEALYDAGYDPVGDPKYDFLTEEQKIMMRDSWLPQGDYRIDPRHEQQYAAAQIQMEKATDRIVANEKEHLEWVKSHPELIPREAWEEGAFNNPSLLLDPGYWMYEISSIMGYALPMLAVGVAATAVGGVPAGIAATAVVSTPVMVGEVFEAARSEGASVQQASTLALVLGPASASIEALGAGPLLKIFSGGLSSQITRTFNRLLVKKVMDNMVAKGLVTFTVLEVTETLEEIGQEVINNIARKAINENVGIFENIPEIAVRTLIGGSALSIFGTAVDFNRATQQDIDSTSDAQKIEQGWKKDDGGNWLKPVPLAEMFDEKVEANEAAGIEGDAARLAAFAEMAANFPEAEQAIADYIQEQEEIVPEVTAPVTPTLEAFRGMTDNQIVNTDPNNAISQGGGQYLDARAEAADRIYNSLKKGDQVTFGEKPYTVIESNPSRNILNIRENKTESELASMSEDERTKWMQGQLYTGRSSIRALLMASNTNGVYSEAQLKVPETLTNEQALPEQIQARRRELEQEVDELSAQIDGGVVNQERISELTQEIRDIEDKLNTPSWITDEYGAITPQPETEMTRPEGSAGDIYDRIQMKQTGKGFSDNIKRGWHQFQVKMIDDLYAIKQLRDQAVKSSPALSIEEDPYILARLLRGVNGKSNNFIEKGTFGKKFWKIEKGKAVPNYTGESLENILREVRKPEQWRDFNVYLVSLHATELNALGIETGIDTDQADAAIRELDAKYKNFASLANRIQGYQQRLLDYIQEMGLLSPELRTKLDAKYFAYVPFYRVIENAQSRGFMGKKMANVPSPIKRIKGSKREIINPLESIVKNTYTFIDAAERNQVGIMIANLVDQNPELANVFERVRTPIARVAQVTAKELGLEMDGLTDEQVEEVFDIFRPSFFVKGDEVTVLIDGKKHYYRVDSDLRDALLSLNRESIGMIGHLLALPARWLRAGATLSPDFMVRNPLRDQMTAFVYSKYGFLPGIDFVRGLFSIMRKDSMYELYRSSGAEHAMLVSLDREYLQKTFRQVVEGNKFREYIIHPLKLAQLISEFGEKATRLGEFKAGIRRGANPLEAGYASRNVTLDFAQAGTTSHAINQYIAFFNANVRGWAKMISSFKENPVKTSVKVFAGLTLPSMLLYLANRDDPRWKEIQQWQKDLFWIIFVPGMEEPVRIPKPFELGILFGSGPERVMEYIDTGDPELLKDMLWNFAEAGSPGFIPTALLPVIENMTNYSFFRGYEIVPDSCKKYPPELQYGRYSSGLSRWLGHLLGMSPAKIDNLIYGWTGGLGRYFTNTLEPIMRKTGVISDVPGPSPTLADLPVIKAFIVRNPYGSSGASVDNFYDTLEEYEQGEKYLQEMLNTGDQEAFDRYKSAHPELLFFMDYEKDTFYSASARYLRSVARQLSEIGRKQDEIYKDPDMSSAKKRELIDELDKQKTELAKKALELLSGGELINEQVNTMVNLLGEIEDESPELSLFPNDYYTLKNLSSDFNTMLQGLTEQDMAELDPLTVSWLKKEQTENVIEGMASKPIYQITPGIAEGYSFEDYYQQWKAGLIDDTELENLSRRELELLREYNRLTEEERASFLDEHPELKANPKHEYLISHPEENALMAFWGQEKIYTKEAYDILVGMIDDLDVPDNALADIGTSSMKDIMSLSEESVGHYFDYVDAVEQYAANSAEARIVIAQDDSLREALNLSEEETPIESLNIQIANRELREEFEALSLEADRDAFREREPQYFEDLERIKVYNAGGTESQVNLWLELYAEKQEHGDTSSEVKDWWLNNDTFHQWAKDNGLVDPDHDVNWDERSIKYLSTWREDIDAYNALLSDEDREDYYANNTKFHQAVYEQQAYDLGLDAVADDYVFYYTDQTLNKPDDWKYDLWFEDDWWLIEHPEFHEAMVDKGQWKQTKDFSKVPTREVWDLYTEWEAMRDENGKALSKERRRFEAKNPELDYWLHLKFGTKLEDVNKGYVPPDEVEWKPNPESIDKLVSDYGFTEQQAKQALGYSMYDLPLEWGTSEWSLPMDSEENILAIIDRVSDEFTPREILEQMQNLTTAEQHIAGGYEPPKISEVTYIPDPIRNFLEESKIDAYPYGEWGTCAKFARELANEASAKGIPIGYAEIQFKGLSFKYTGIDGVNPTILREFLEEQDLMGELEGLGRRGWGFTNGYQPWLDFLEAHPEYAQNITFPDSKSIFIAKEDGHAINWFEHNGTIYYIEPQTDEIMTFEQLDRAWSSYGGVLPEMKRETIR